MTARPDSERNRALLELAQRTAELVCQPEPRVSVVTRFSNSEDAIEVLLAYRDEGRTRYALTTISGEALLHARYTGSGATVDLVRDEVRRSFETLRLEAVGWTHNADGSWRSPRGQPYPVTGIFKLTQKAKPQLAENELGPIKL